MRNQLHEDFREQINRNTVRRQKRLAKHGLRHLFKQLGDYEDVFQVKLNSGEVINRIVIRNGVILGKIEDSERGARNNFLDPSFEGINGENIDAVRYEQQSIFSSGWLTWIKRQKP